MTIRHSCRNTGILHPAQPPPIQMTKCRRSSGALLPYLVPAHRCRLDCSATYLAIACVLGLHPSTTILPPQTRSPAYLASRVSVPCCIPVMRAPPPQRTGALLLQGGSFAGGGHPWATSLAGWYRDRGGASRGEAALPADRAGARHAVDAIAWLARRGRVALGVARQAHLRSTERCVLLGARGARVIF